MPKITMHPGEARRVVADLDRLVGYIRPAVQSEIETTGRKLLDDVRRSVGRGRKSGRRYDFRPLEPGERPDEFRRIAGNLVPVKRRSRPHRASAPGQRPASDTGNLLQALDLRVEDGQAMVGVFKPSDALFYAVFLEHGTQRMAARPFLAPASKRRRFKYRKDMTKTISDAISAGGFP